MSKDKTKKASGSKKSRMSPDRKKKKKSRVKKTKDRSHDRSETQVQPCQDVAKFKTKTADELEPTGTGDCNGGRIEKSIPIEPSIDAASKNDVTSRSGGWSWGAAFAVASKVQPDDSHLDDNFLKKAATNSDQSNQEGFMDISRLANDHSKALSNGVTTNGNDAIDRTLKRKRIGSDAAAAAADDDDGALSTKSDDVSLEGSMVPNPTVHDNANTTLVLVHKQSGTVYSSGKRTKDGRRLVVGKISKGKIELDPLSIEEMKRLDEGEETMGPSFPYPTNPDDHCETPLQSYKDVLPLLNELCKTSGGDKQSMRIYDPYFCDGSVVNHLSSLGFANVYNKKEDCYAVWKSNFEPEFDVFLTNPPYSEDHIEKLMRYVTSHSFGNKPWLLLMPQWVHKKDYYIKATTKNRTRDINPFYIVPKKRYVYLPPTNFREKKESDVHKKSSPFVSMWYCWGGDEKRNEKLMNAFRKSSASGDCDVARSKSALRDLRRDGGNKGKKKKKSRTGK